MRESEKHRADDPGHIVFKMNALEDPDIARALYQAAQVGVRVDLIVRDSCRVRPGIPGLSEKIRVISIVSRFLEHARIYYFRNGGDEEFFIGSADAMRRNLEHRVEVLVPVEAPELRKDLWAMLEVQLSDRRSAWELQPDGSYVQSTPGPDDDPRSAQERLIELANQRAQDAGRLRRRKNKGVGARNLR